ncbi:MAG: hypothetical protein RBS10_00450 [Thauera propionica]|nr:hypothetical protein [Thauera propionica]
MSLAEQSRKVLLARNPELSLLERRYPPRRLIDEFDASDPFMGYGYVPDRVSAAIDELRVLCSGRTLSDYLYLMLFEVAEGFESRFVRSGLPLFLKQEFGDNLRRIALAAEEDDARSKASLSNDVFMKDFGIARQILIPCASHLVYRHAGVPRRLLFTLPRMRDRVSLLKTLLLDTHGFRPFMENHVHLPMLNEFNPDGRERCFGLVAELLRFIPESLGLIGTSWYYDPELSEVSPGLAYLHRVPAEKGAVFLDLGESEQARRDAAARSTRRRTLIEQGDYRPRLTMMIWSRRDILAHY